MSPLTQARLAFIGSVDDKTIKSASGFEYTDDEDGDNGHAYFVRFTYPIANDINRDHAVKLRKELESMVVISIGASSFALKKDGELKEFLKHARRNGSIAFGKPLNPTQLTQALLKIGVTKPQFTKSTKFPKKVPS